MIKITFFSVKYKTYFDRKESKTFWNKIIEPRMNTMSDTVSVIVTLVLHVLNLNTLKWQCMHNFNTIISIILYLNL